MFTEQKKKEAIAYLKSSTRSIPDYPKKGIVFRDLTTIFQDEIAMGVALDLMESLLKDEKGNRLPFTRIVGVEARGFILAGGLVGRLGGGIVMARKPGKLPFNKRRVNYKLEYGEDALEMHEDAICREDKIIVLDDLLATGGTAQAACKLVEELGGEILKVIFLVELPELGGRKRISNYTVESLISFEGH